jgi:GMP synthase (glutamine-hydrolysing)
MDEKVLVVDFGSQYTHLLARRIRSLGVYSEIIYPEDLSRSVDVSVKGYVFSGGPMSVYDDSSPKVDRDTVLSLGRPILGVCYGHQLLAYIFGGRVEGGEAAEYGRAQLFLKCVNSLVEGLPESSVVWMSHKDNVLSPPDGFVVVGYTDYTPVAIMANDSLKIYGVQFHPEVRHSVFGLDILRNFIYGVCGCVGGWSPMDLVNKFVSEHRHLSGERAIIGVSGGIDSTVAALILRQVFGDNLFLVFIDNGLLRYGEADWVRSLFEGLGFKNFISVDASDRFLGRLRGVTDPELKRSIIADTFVEVFREVAERLSNEYGVIRYLGQGTLYPDRVESGSTGRYVDKIKSHHNVSMSTLLGFELLEPLRDMYKDEVREVGLKLGLPRDVLYRHPFPGPALAVRIVGEVTPERLRILRDADRIVEEELRRSGLYDRVWQAFPVLISLKSVGIKGDRRSYEYILALRIVESVDAMTASFCKVDWDLLERISSRLLNEVEGINRVLYDISNKPPATIEFE